VVEWGAELGIAVIAHSPLGGPRHAGRLRREQALAEVASGRGVTPAEVALAWLLELSPAVVAIPGARRPETARSAARAGTLALDAGDKDLLGPAVARPAGPERQRPAVEADVVLVIGIPAAGKSRVAEEYVA